MNMAVTESDLKGPKNGHNFLMTVRAVSWACGHVTEMWFQKKYFRSDHTRANLRCNRPKKCPTIFYRVNLLLNHVSAGVSSLFRQVDIPTGRYSDRSLFRQVDIPTGRYSDRSLFRQVDIPTGRYSDRSIFRQVVIPTGRYSDRSLFRQVYILTGRYSDRSLFRQFLDLNCNGN